MTLYRQFVPYLLIAAVFTFFFGKPVSAQTMFSSIEVRFGGGPYIFYRLKP